MQLGQEVLNKVRIQISDLLVQIDRPKSPRRKPRKQVREQKDKSNTNDNNDKEKVRLYQNYKIIRDKAHERQKQRIKTQMQKNQTFKVQNKHSIFLNSRKNLRPLHERTPDILLQKQLSLQKRRTQINLERERKKKLLANEQQDEQAIYQAQQRSRKIASRQQIDQMIKRLTDRERQRMQKSNRQKMDYLKQKLMNNREKPSMNKKSSKIWQKVKIEKQLSPNVFERFDKYNWDRKKSQENYTNRIKEKQTPFKPSISKNSIEILNKSGSSRLELTKDLERTRSCKCFTKQGASQRSFINHNHENSRNNNSSRLQPSVKQNASQKTSLSPSPIK